MLDETVISKQDPSTVSGEQASDAITIDPVSWVEEAARIVISRQTGPLPRVRFEVTAPSDLARVVVGRPAEELPRILPAQSSVSAIAHHLASARALDQVFGVQPPPAGEALRRALLLADFIRAHLRRLAFQLAAPGSPIAVSAALRHRSVAAPNHQWSAPQHSLPAGFIEEIMRGAMLAQEALEIVGGRVGLPICAVPGGVACALDERGRDRLIAVTASLSNLSQRIETVLNEALFTDSEWLAFFTSEAFSVPIASLAISSGEDGSDWYSESIRVVGPDGAEMARFDPSEHADYLTEHEEPWSYQPFAHLKAHPWPGLDGVTVDGLFGVGPLARINVSGRAQTGEVSTEQHRLAEIFGAHPWHSLAASVWAILNELLTAGEALSALSQDGAIAGTDVRVLPSQVIGEGAAAVESPVGLVLHTYRTDERGVVRQARVFDPATLNNAARNLAARRAARYVLDHGSLDHSEMRLIEYAVAAY